MEDMTSLFLHSRLDNHYLLDKFYQGSFTQIQGPLQHKNFIYLLNSGP
jgi:hypothetical protein